MAQHLGIADEQALHDLYVSVHDEEPPVEARVRFPSRRDAPAMRPRSLAEVVDRTARDADWDHHLMEFLDTFYTADGDCAAQASMIAAHPGFIGAERPDAFIGGVGEHLARRWQLPIPAWVRDEARYLERPMFVPDEAPLRAYLLAASPVAFRTRAHLHGTRSAPACPLPLPPWNHRSAGGRLIRDRPGYPLNIDPLYPTIYVDGMGMV